ncbi:MAG: hypothetical protein EAZ78_27505 [Oscillatoriales cyanobacterium]|uniref:hypothetical protein n=1 Tax=Microcoleus sp. PH2017_16_JOR_D_A TaxID=2798827 RepID=UPI001D3EBF85|nr:hypothetical protein [Microcoleus sp. PH2017_16_JOR_D_A]TAE12319.1 MAG: hypothetical protein EAZ94_13285 [Oscillatoriales cyanobacterium]TAE24421.1 MAG: hypothetical protein EAZ93_13410 [Oscillatoriales cyanobacterium]TAE42749.1 MAG: hypothetical protein EAZ90_13670 [Oscillatoriales cyanobacterium]TAE65617.1 MAG: hypothetical protein EAZ86_23995 [Oscillatoriales cyanobacterium]TAE95770.1 MAG: hypothetical protein EAZ78_27505 [Oscillatoriales cyanobacterium]
MKNSDVRSSCQPRCAAQLALFGLNNYIIFCSIFAFRFTEYSTQYLALMQYSSCEFRETKHSIQ